MVFHRRKKPASDTEPAPKQRKTTAPPRTTASSCQSQDHGHCAKPKPCRGDWNRAAARNIVVMGDGLAAGMGDFSLKENHQRNSFPALLASALGESLSQPLFQEPGLGHPIGFANVAVAAPTLFQTTAFVHIPTTSTANLSIPGFTPNDAIRYRPQPPLLEGNGANRAIANLILGMPRSQSEDNAPYPTQIEAALGQNPTMIFVQLGYDMLMDFAVNGGTPPDMAAFEEDYAYLLEQLSESGTNVVVMTVPNPIDTAYFTVATAAADALNINPDAFLRFYGLGESDYLTPLGIMDIGYQIQNQATTPLPGDAIIRSWQAVGLAEYAMSVNETIYRLSDRFGCPVFPLHKLFADMKGPKVNVSDQAVSGNYLGGFFGLNGVYPGAVGNGLIANELLSFLGSYMGTDFTPIDLGPLRALDATANITPAQGKPWNYEQLLPPQYDQPPQPPQDAAGLYDNRVVFKPLPQPLALPQSLEMTVPLNHDISYHGDAMKLVNTHDPRAAQFGNTANLLFGGLAFFGSRLKGTLHFRFSPPENNKTHFVMTFVEGALSGENSTLECPSLYRFPIREARVFALPNQVCEGDLDLTTGFGSKMKFFLIFQNTGLGVLQQMNPTFPKVPIPFTDIEIKDPPVYATAFAQFFQTDDGGLDFDFHGTAFVPLGPGIRFPLPIRGADGTFAAFDASGTVLHPHIYLSTRQPKTYESDPKPLVLPENQTIELTANTYTTSFGDDFTLNNPELGIAEGRSPLTGRVQIQFGPRFGDILNFGVSILPPAGLFTDPTLRPLQDNFPAKLSRGLLGHNEFLKFPNRIFYLDNVYFLEDPFDLALGAINLRTGQVIGDFLHRGLIGQNLIFALVRVEPRTPQASFQFRGPARFDQDENGRLRYRFSGTLLIPYPEGFLFPEPDLATGTVIGSDSKLDPFLDIDAHGDLREWTSFEDIREGVVSATGGTFDYRCQIPSEPGAPAQFHFVDHQMGGATFTMFANGLVSVRATEVATGSVGMTFTGYGRWSLDPNPNAVHIATVQIIQQPEFYISVLINGGVVDNVTTAPAPNKNVLP